MPDPLLTLRQLLAKAYTDAFALSRPRSQVVRQLKAEIEGEHLAEIIPTHLASLEAIVRARSLGGRCGDHISQAQLELLKAALREE